MSSVTIQIVGWNSAVHLRQAAMTLKRIPAEDVVIRYIDNASTDESVVIIRTVLPEADVIELGKNMGYAAAHNVGFAKCATPFVLTHDPDLELNWEGIQHLLNVFSDSKVAAVQGKLLRVDGKIDSAGIIQTLTLNGVERGANEDNHGQYDTRSQIFAATGACALYRVSALKKIAHRTSAQMKTQINADTTLQIFDEDFFSYKEDVDLGWRLNRAGWKVLYVPYLVGVHHRTLGKRGFAGWGLNPKNIFQRLSSRRTYYSLRNYVWMIVKNVSFWQGVKHEIFIDARLLLFFIFSLFYWPLLPVWVAILRGIPRMISKRKA